MAKQKIRPLEDRVVIQQIEAEEKTAGRDLEVYSDDVEAPPEGGAPAILLNEFHGATDVGAAVREALRFPAIAFDAVKHLLLGAIECRPPKLDLENYPHLPMAEVALTRAADYQVLLQEVR